MILLPFSSVCQTSGYDSDDAISVGVNDCNHDQPFDGADADLAGLSVVATVVDAGQNIALEDLPGFLERDPVLDLVDDIFRSVPFILHVKM
ncbi:MAG: hypothetical protein O9309_18705 [Rhizobium sp.]|nr:hypothetical protein [Rhizobium sp.]MCZ8351677.1 hypothetical protein [Rhizobium sp.]